MEVPFSPAGRSVAELKRRLRELGQEAPVGMCEKSELRALVEEAERQHAQKASHASKHEEAPRSSSSPPATPASPDDNSKARTSTSPAKDGQLKTVAQLKRRLRELGLDDRNIIEKAELVALVEEADRQKAAPQTPSPATKRFGRSVAQLKIRLQELGVEIPKGGVEKRELVMLIEEAERRQGLHKYGDRMFTEDRGSEKPEEHLSTEKHMTAQVSCRRASKGVVQISLDEDEAAAKFALSSKGEVVMRGAHFTWLKGKLLGRGSLGLVFQAKDQASGQLMAVKEVFIGAEDGEAGFMSAMQNEIDIMKMLKHPHIVSYLGHDFIEDRLYVYMDYMPGGSMERVLKDVGALDEVLIAKYSAQLLQGLDYLHGQAPPLLHRDIKCANILIGLADLVKLADFGCSKRTEDTKTQTMLRGSIPWMAPEVVASSRYSPASDIWSFGCSVIEMGTARMPWGTFENQVAALIKIGMSSETPPLPEGVSPECQGFILQCVQRDASRRPSAGELLRHELVRRSIS